MRKIHYGWLIVISAILITGVAGGMAINCFSRFIVPVCDDLDFSRGEMGLCQTINGMGFLVFSFISGWLLKRIPLKKLMCTAAVAITVFYFLFSKATKIWMFYGCAAVVSICAAMLTWVPFSVILTNWFVKSRALAIGIAFMGSGVGGMVASAVGGPLLEAVGWRMTFVWFAVALAVILLPLMFFVIHVSPADCGRRPYGEDNMTVQKAEEENSGALLKDAVRTPWFYLIAACLFAFGLASNGYTNTFVPHMQDNGYDPVTASTLFSVYMLLLAVSKVIMGVIFDKIGTNRTTLLGITLMAITIAGLIFCRFPLAIAIMLAVSGLGNCYTTVGIPVMARTVYGKRDYAAFTGMLNAACHVGSTLAPGGLGFVRDFAGAYTPGYCAVIVLMVLTGAGMMAALSQLGKKTFIQN